MKNIGGYDEFSFIDSDACDLLSRFLKKYREIKPRFKDEDKAPNFDGRLELCEITDKKSIPYATIDVQIKTLNHDYTNHNTKYNISQYKYSCDTKAMNAVLEGITLNPVLLFLVDVMKEKIFWIYLSLSYIVKLDIKDDKDKTIYFNDTNLISDYHEFLKLLRP